MSSTSITPSATGGALGAPAPRSPRPPKREHWADKVETRSRSMTALGLTASALFVFGFGAWAVTAPLASAAVASGYVAAAGRNLVIQHLEGGIIEEIAIREGDRVTRGQTLFVLDATPATAQRNRLRNQLFAIQARASRLQAERDGDSALRFPAGLDAAGDPVRQNILDEQNKEFVTKLEGQRREIAILQQQIGALDEEILGVADQKVASENQLAVINDEVARKKGLLDRGLTNRNEYTQVLLSQSELTGQIGQFGASVLAARTEIAGRREQIARQESHRVEVAANELNTARAEIADLEEQLDAAEAVVSRVVVRSPSDGVILKLNYNVSGAVVGAGQPMVEILPTSQDLIVEARIPPQDIDSVHMSQIAELRFTALNRLTPTVDAAVTYVSPDRLVDPRTEQPYYLARLRITDNLPPSIDRSQIYPGMPVETFIRTGERTFLEYLLKPIEDSFNRAFRER